MEESDTCLFIANLPQQRSNQQLSLDLRNMFKEFGSLVSVKASRDKKGRPFGFLQFEEAEDAAKASKEGVNLKLHGRQLRIERAKCAKTLVIRNLTLSESAFIQACSKFGPVLLCQSVWAYPWYIPQEYPPIQIGCVQFKHRADAIIAYREFKSKNPEWDICWTPNQYATDPIHWIAADDMNCPMWDTKPPATQSAPAEESIADSGCIASDADIERNVFVGRLNPCVVETELVSHFEKYGTLENVNLVNRQKNSVNLPLDAFAILTYERREDAERAIASENGNVFLGQALKVEFARPSYQKVVDPVNVLYVTPEMAHNVTQKYA